MLPSSEPCAPAEPYLTFLVGGVRFAVPAAIVNAILPCRGRIPIPGTPPSIQGVVNVGGSVVVLVDLAVKLGMGRSFPTSDARILVLDVGATLGRVRLGILAHEVSGVVALRPEDVHPVTRPDGTSILHVPGVAAAGGCSCVLLAVERVLTPSDLALAAAVEVLGTPARARVS